MILRQILEKNEEELTIFRGEINKEGLFVNYKNSTVNCVQEIFNQKT